MLKSPTTMTEQDMLRWIDGLPSEIDAETYDHLAGITIEPQELAALRRLDPMGTEYRRICAALYARLSGRSDYTPERDERSGLGSTPDIWRQISPYSFKSPKLVSEFLSSWAAIISALDVEPEQSVIEYGPGSGQALLMLARCGVRAFGVDIDADSLDLVRRQSEAMGLDVQLELGAFGEGFAGCCSSRRFTMRWSSTNCFSDCMIGCYPAASSYSAENLSSKKVSTLRSLSPGGLAWMPSVSSACGTEGGWNLVFSAHFSRS
jgi:SAM-dependent methyltransferase